MYSRILIPVFALTFVAGFFVYTDIAKADVARQGLISSWTFDANTIAGNTARDVWGNNNGTLFGNPKVEKGIFGEALRFNGAKTYIDCGDDKSLDFERDDAFSAEVWMNVDTKAGAHMVVLGKMLAAGTYAGWTLWYRGAAPDPETIQILLRNDNASGNFIHVRTQNTMPDTEWIHLLMTYDGSSKAAGVKLYVNGVDEPFVVVKDALSDDMRDKGSFNIGARDFGTTFFKGLIDETRLYNRVLDEDEVTQNFNAQGFKAAVEPGGKLAATWGRIRTSS